MAFDSNRRGPTQVLVTEASKGFERPDCSDPSRVPVRFETDAMGVGLPGGAGDDRSAEQYGPIGIGAAAGVDPWR